MIIREKPREYEAFRYDGTYKSHQELIQFIRDHNTDSRRRFTITMWEGMSVIYVLDRGVKVASIYIGETIAASNVDDSFPFIILSKKDLENDFDILEE